MTHHIISASILSADFACLGDEAKQVLQAGVDSIHFDVMDHHFVPNLSFGAVVCDSLRNAGINAPIDVHLMVEHPADYIQSFAATGASLLTFHPETVENVAHTVQQIRCAGMKAGLAFNPEKTLNIAPEVLQQIDLILIMSVHPGFSGQTFLPASLEKISHARALITKAAADARLGVDGGIKATNIAAAAQAGADFFVVGSGLFTAHDYTLAVAELRRQLIS